ncbi:MAG: PEP-CTERM sorting domain-containing protein [Pirellulales bacterium]
MKRVVFAVALLCSATLAFAAPVTPFTETFNTGNSDWRQNVSANFATWTANGGPAGVGDGYISATYATINSGSVLLRGTGNATPPASGGAFVGDWIAGGVKSINFWVRHTNSTPLTLGLRMASPTGGQAMIGLASTPVDPNVWTQVSVPLNPNTLTPEAIGAMTLDQYYTAVFSNILNVQLTYTASSPATNATFDMSSLTLSADPLPEPGTWSALAAAAAIGGVVWRRRRAK